MAITSTQMDTTEAEDFDNTFRQISVVVPAFNEERLIARCLGAIRRALEAFEECGWQTDLIVCDNGSTDLTREIAEGEGARVVFEPINQISRARNRGAAEVETGWLIFVDADSFPSKALFSEIEQAITSGKVIGGGCTIEFDEHRWWSHPLMGLWNWISRMKGWAAGSLMFCDITAFKELHGFSEEVFAGEEIDFFQRLRQRAKESGKEIVILTRHPMLTSGRKLSLYPPRDHFRFIGRALISPKKTMASPGACHVWYDGRR